MIFVRVLITYDVATTTKEGKRRLRRVSRACLDFGQRVQWSVFECELRELDWSKLRNRLLSEFDSKEDSLRFYFLDEAAIANAEHHGVRAGWDFRAPWIT